MKYSPLDVKTTIHQFNLQRTQTKIRQTNKNHFVVNMIYLKVHFLSQYLVLPDRTTQWSLSFLLIRLTTILWLIQLQLLIMLEAVYFSSKWCLFEPIFFYGFWCLFICSFVVFQILSVTNFWIDCYLFILLREKYI